jgi:hypothetical protein
MKKAPSLSQALKPLDRRTVSGPSRPSPAPATRRSPVPATRAGKKTLSFYVSLECRTHLKVTAAAQQRPLEQCLTEALNDWFKKYGKAELA